MEFKTLYGKNKDGSFKVWSISVEGNKITITHGKENGKMQTKTEEIAGKNIGRSNETSPEQQALLEAQSRYKKQLDKGYREDKESLEDIKLLPMLSMDYNKQGHRMPFPCFGSPKLDGVRCLAIKHNDRVELRSRGGKEYCVPHIQEALFNTMCEGEMLDGELYIHGFYLEEILSAAKSPDNPTKQQLQYYVFDAPHLDDPFETRYVWYKNFVFYREPNSVHLVKQYNVSNKEEIKELHDNFVRAGYEGIMLRNKDSFYSFGDRSEHSQKYKEMVDEEFRITGVEEDRNGNAVLQCYDGVAKAYFNVTFGDFTERKHQLTYPEQYVGKWLTVAYQARYKDSKLVQFPVGKAIRGCDKNGNPLE